MISRAVQMICKEAFLSFDIIRINENTKERWMSLIHYGMETGEFKAAAHYVETVRLLLLTCAD